ncbi:MAG: hypothetical protein NTV01_06715, partial [Bacteroidia bacterium]|nr:hypothetical protein [Bacteroidia bacterium]
EPFEFRVIKGGVYDLEVTAGQFADAHFLTWQLQEKKILQVQPEWLTLYATAERVVKCKAYYLDNGHVANETVTLATVPADHLQTLDVSWGAICDAVAATEPIAWDIWFEDGSWNRLSYIQRLQLRNASDEENVFIWANTLGGVDSAAFTGYAEDDQKLEHQIAELYSEALDEYRIDKKTEIKQSTGFLTARESVWLRDFFYSIRRYKVELDGSIRSIVLVDSKVVSTTADDLHEYEFSYRYSSDSNLLNLDHVVTDLPAPEGLTDFFLTELLSGLPTAHYDGNLIFAVQSPFAEGWMKLSLDQLFNSALPEFIDNKTIRFINGKLCTDVGAVIAGMKPKHGFESALTSILAFNNSTRSFSITTQDVVSFPVWNMGDQLLKTTESSAIENTVGTWYIYYSDDEVLGNMLCATLTSWDRNKDIPIATVAWDGSEGVVKDYRYVYTEVNHAPLVRFQDKPHPAEDIYTDITNFNELLDEHDIDLQKALDKFDNHKHWKLYTPDYLNGFIYTSLVDGIPTLNILGNIIQDGSAYETHIEQVYTKDDLIILRDGAISGLSVGQYAGFKAKLYDGVNDGLLVFDSNGIARVGDVGYEQPIATRIETPTDGYLAIWDSVNTRLNFINNNTYEPAINKSTGFLKWSGSAWAWDTATYLTSETSHGDVVVDGDFTSQGIMLRGASAGSYSVLTDNSTNWDTAYNWGNHASAGYLTSLAHNLAGDVSGAYGANTV